VDRLGFVSGQATAAPQLRAAPASCHCARAQSSGIATCDCFGLAGFGTPVSAAAGSLGFVIAASAGITKRRKFAGDGRI
jgi:hypothetical protein